MELVQIKYSNLTAKQKEIYNFQKVAAILADYGFNCIKLADDWQGADFLAYHKDGNDTLKIQLKSRLTIAKKYANKNLFVAFPVDGQWYLIQHDRLLEIVAAETKWLATKSWVEDELYSSRKPNQKILHEISYAKLISK